MARSRESVQLQKYLRGVLRTLRDPHEYADPFRTLETYAEWCEREMRTARKKQAARRDDRVRFH